MNNCVRCDERPAVLCNECHRAEVSRVERENVAVVALAGAAAEKHGARIKQLESALQAIKLILGDAKCPLDECDMERRQALAWANDALAGSRWISPTSRAPEPEATGDA